ncbi:hypothetical protein KDW_51640 [Dictyobacter vulcani]|uniref:DnaD N-terminal domain-containing protein n=1 Tax=Dictyobacter vulcani TaxID=2607529 RepID=A0A5J4KUY6_9CHLR|nr:hypothetical protein [Dictyobacter vulcani]GER91002.1 hypothetical protein KDW_51640 [Dictyobacter vulcani]
MGIIMTQPTTQQLKVLNQPALQPLQEIYDEMILAEGLTVFPVALERYYAKLGMTRAQFDIIKQLLQFWGELGKAPWFGPNDLEENFDKSKRQMQRDLRNLSKDGFIIIHEVDGSDGLHYTQYDCTPFLEMISQLVKLHQHLGTKQKKKPTNLSGLSPFKRGPQMSTSPAPQPEARMSSGTKMSTDLSSHVGTKVSSGTKMSTDSSSQTSTNLSRLALTKPVTDMSGDKYVTVTRPYIRALDVAKVSNSNSKLDNYINIINILFSNSNDTQVQENIPVTDMSLSSKVARHPMADMSLSSKVARHPMADMSENIKTSHVKRTMPIPPPPSQVNKRAVKPSSYQGSTGEQFAERSGRAQPEKIKQIPGGSSRNEIPLPLMSSVALQEASQALHDHNPKISKLYAEQIYGNFVGINRIQDDLSLKNPDASFANLIKYVHHKLKDVDMQALKANHARHGMSLFFTELHACAFEQYKQIKQMREHRHKSLQQPQAVQHSQHTVEKNMPTIPTTPPMTDMSMGSARTKRPMTERGAYLMKQISTESVADSLLALAQERSIFIADKDVEALRTNTASDQLIEKIRTTLLEHVNSAPYPA